MRRWIWIVVITLTLGIASPSFGISVYNFTSADPYTWDYQGSSNLCWAATAANMLAWSGWGMSSDSQTIFGYFQNYWPNSAWYTAGGIQWYFNGNSTVPGGDFYPTINVNQYLFTTNYLIGLQQFILAGDAVSVGVWQSLTGIGHALTVWGYETDNKGNLDGLWVTNSWSPTNPGLQLISAIWDPTIGFWRTNFWGNDTGIVSGVTALERNPASPISIPEPSILVLLGIGLTGVLIKKEMLN